MKIFMLVDRILQKKDQQGEIYSEVYPELIPVDRIAGVRRFVSNNENTKDVEWTFVRLTGNGTERDGDTFHILIDEKFEDFIKRLGKKPNVEIINH